MNLQLYIKPNEIGLEFLSNADRDQWWNGLANNPVGDFVPQDACEKIGARFIRVHPEKMKARYSWAFQSLPASRVVKIAEKPKKPAAPAPAAQVAHHPPTEIGVDAASLTAPAPIAPIAIIPREDAPPATATAATVIPEPVKPKPIPIPEMTQMPAPEPAEKSAAPKKSVKAKPEAKQPS